VIGGTVGWGLKRNVLDLYKFVCGNYPNPDGKQEIAIRDEDRPDIYAFGFSRGSFTIRVLVDLIAIEGLVTFRSEGNAAVAYRHYRSTNFPSWSPLVKVIRWLRDALLWSYPRYKKVKEQTKVAGRAEIPIRFLGLWDTVETYGVPIDELKRGID
jgi:uncharacterized protein (DUF2235 family)